MFVCLRRCCSYKMLIIACWCMCILRYAHFDTPQSNLHKQTINACKNTSSPLKNPTRTNPSMSMSLWGETIALPDVLFVLVDVGRRPKASPRVECFCVLECLQNYRLSRNNIANALLSSCILDWLHLNGPEEGYGSREHTRELRHQNTVMFVHYLHEYNDEWEFCLHRSIHRSV